MIQYKEIARLPENVPVCVYCRHHFYRGDNTTRVVMCGHPKTASHDIVTGDSAVKAKVARRGDGGGGGGVCGLTGKLFESPTFLEANYVPIIFWAVVAVGATWAYWPLIGG